MKLSIIVPVYNMVSGGKLEYCLQSLVHQTIDDFEIIAVDDCSTDNSMEVLQRYQAEYPTFFRAIHSEVNKKQGGAKNIGLAAAKGDWIGFVDSDDWIAPNMYEKMLARAEETGADMVGCDYHLTHEHSMEIGQVVHNNKEEQVGVLTLEKYKSLVLDGGSLVVKIYKRDVVLGSDSRFPEGIFYEDNALAKTWLTRAKHFEYIREPLYYYYQHDTSTVHTIDENRCEHRMEAGRIMIEEAMKGGYYKEYRDEIEMSFITLFYVNTLFSYMIGVKKKRFAFLDALGKEMKEQIPDFENNPYYKERVHPEERKLIRMHMKSTLYFMLYYKLLWTYRNLRKRCKGM
ncbi:MAG: glycosyltransferase [Lachnospiraceae bacterium]